MATYDGRHNFFSDELFAPAVRWERVIQLRDQIARGTYATPLRWERAVERLLAGL